MSYRPNQSQQLSIFDRSLRLTERERKCLEKSWAKVFSDEIFPAIDEERFRVLYSENASRPNTPVNIIVGALIIKELFDLSDDEMVENLMLDIHYQYALRTTNFEEQPLSDKTLSRFRRRCYEYECAHGVDLFHDCVKDLSEKIAKMMGINSRIKRMDSLMIEANIRNLSRIELLYSCVARAVKYHHKNHTGMDLSGLEHYTDPDDRNLVIYHSRNIDIDTRTAAIIKDADILLERCQDKYSHVKEHQLLLRCLEEQTAIDNGGRRLRIKGEESPKPTSLQNPTDPEATFSAKAGKKHIGYVANIVETVSNGGSVIVDYQYEQNIYSDSRFLGDHLDQLPPQEAPAFIVMDGAYSGQMHRDAAAEKNVKLINTSLKGTPVPDIYADFEISKDGEQILRCPAGHKPTRCKYISTSNQVKAYFPNEACSQCPHLEHCHPKLRKCSSLIVLSRSAIGRANQQRLIAAEDFRNWRRIRNGVEAIPAILRNCYHVDEMPVRGKIPGKFFFGAKISAVNFKKLLRQRRGFCCHSPNPLLT